jgi:2-aminobenzoate-CoA ligase
VSSSVEDKELTSLIERYGPPKEMWPEFRLDFPEAQRWPKIMNIAEVLVDDNVRAGRGDKPAYLYGERKITYSELLRAVNVFGNALKFLGVGVSDRVVLRLPNIPEFPISCLAVQKIGAVSVCTFPLLRAKELSYICNDCEAKVIVTTPDLLSEVEKAKEELKTIKQVIVASAKTGEVGDQYIVFDDLIDSFKDSVELSPVRVDYDEAALILYTSGTTGPPKGCIHTHREYLAVADCYAKKVLKADKDDVWGGPVSMAFAYGHTGLLGNPLKHGAAASLYGPRKFDPIRFFTIIEKHKLSVLYAVPTAYRAMVAAKDESRHYDLSSLRVCVTAGEPCPPTLYHEIKRLFGCEVLEHMGSTELFNGFISSQFGKVKPGSAGLPVPGYELKIFDEGGREVPRGVVGYLAVKGPVGTRYWRRPEKQAEYVKDGWNYTGDMGYLDGDGFFFYVGRGDDIIKTAAYRVSPHEVEEVLMEHPAVAEAGVVGVPDERIGQAVKAFIVLRPDYKPSSMLAEELKTFVKNRIAPYKAPRHVEFIAELPKTETGKIRRIELRRLELEKHKPLQSHG